MLVKSIKIDNFRCFNKTKGNDFGRINLIGGKNNAGKTALLEALFLMNEPSNRTIHYLLKFRREDTDFIKNMPKRAWDNFFFKGLKENEISISSKSDDNIERTVKIRCEESVQEFIKNVQKNKEEEDLMAFFSSLNNKDEIKSALHIDAFVETNKLNSNVFIASADGIVGHGIPHSFRNTHLIPASYKQSNEDLAAAFDKAKLEDKADILLDAFRVIDTSLEKVDTLSIGKSAIFLKRQGEGYMPLTLYGDAMNKIADFILRIVNNKNSLILLDEIENGIHHTHQEKLWEMIFSLTKQYDVQLFATSHSEEMIQAFKNVVTKFNYQNEARYFELARHSISNEITIQKLSMDVLEDKLSNKKPVRGE